MPDFEIFIDKPGFYKTRIGNRVEIVGRAVGGLWLGLDHNMEADTWATSGKYVDGSGATYARDIVALWEDASPVVETGTCGVVDEPCLAINPGNGWRLLQPDERVAKGDECILKGSEKDSWEASENVGRRQSQICYYRRRIPVPDPPAETQVFEEAERDPCAPQPLKVGDLVECTSMSPMYNRNRGRVVAVHEDHVDVDLGDGTHPIPLGRVMATRDIPPPADPPQPKFKVGDRVRHKTTGSLARVITVYSYTGGTQVRGDNGFTWWNHESDLELIPEEPKQCERDWEPTEEWAWVRCKISAIGSVMVRTEEASLGGPWQYPVQLCRKWTNGASTEWRPVGVSQ